MKRTTVRLFLSYTLLALAACSATPSDGTIQTAIVQTAVAEKAARVTPSPTVSNAASATAISGTPVATTLALYAQSDLGRFVLQPNETSWSLRESHSLGQAELAKNSGQSGFQGIPPQAGESHTYSPEKNPYKDMILSSALLFKDTETASQYFQWLSQNTDKFLHSAEFASALQKAGAELRTRKDAAIDHEGLEWWDSNFAEYQATWRRDNIVWSLLIANEARQLSAQDLQTIASGMRSR